MDKKEIKNLIKECIREELEELLASDRYIFSKTVQFLDGRNIQAGKTNGTKIGTEGGATGQKIGFFGTTPTTQRTGVAVTAGGIHTALVELGLVTA